MKTSQILGVVVLIIGAVLIVIGVSASRSLADNVSNFFTGRFTRDTMWYLIGGAGVAVVGVLLLLGVFGRR